MTPPAGTDTSLAGFFERYAAASQGGDPRLLAALYAPTFIVGGPKGSQAFANDATFHKWIEQLRELNQQRGMTALVPAAIEQRPMSPIHSVAIVTWSARFTKTGDMPIVFRIMYLVETAGTPKILAYISEADEEDEMKRLGLL